MEMDYPLQAGLDLSDSITERVRDPVQLRPRTGTELEQKLAPIKSFYLCIYLIIYSFSPYVLSNYKKKSQKTVMLDIKYL